MFGDDVSPSETRKDGRQTPFEIPFISQNGEKRSPCGSYENSGFQSIFALRPSGDLAKSQTLP